MLTIEHLVLGKQVLYLNCDSCQVSCNRNLSFRDMKCQTYHRFSDNFAYVQNVLIVVTLTHFSPMSHFYTP